VSLADRIVRGEDSVINLLNQASFKRSFPDGPPSSVRASLFHYDFVRTPSDWRDGFSDDFRGGEEGNWWRRKKVGDYLPPITNNDPQVAGFLKQTRMEAIEKKNVKSDNFIASILREMRKRILLLVGDSHLVASILILLLLLFLSLPLKFLNRNKK